MILFFQGSSTIFYVLCNLCDTESHSVTLTYDIILTYNPKIKIKGMKMQM